MKTFSFWELSEAAKQNAIEAELERRIQELGNEECLVDDEGEDWSDEDIAEYLTIASVLSAIEHGWNYFYGEATGLDRWTENGEYIVD